MRREPEGVVGPLLGASTSLLRCMALKGMFRRAWKVAAVIGALCVPAGATMDTAVTAVQLAEAMGIPASMIVSATLLSKGTAPADSVGRAVYTGTLGNFSPREGTTFVVLTSGNVALIPGSNTLASQGHDQGTVDGRGVESGGDDIVTLQIVIDPPDTAGHMSFEHVFLSEEYPEFVGSPYNDFFICEVNGHDIRYDTSSGAAKISSQYNMVYDKSGQIISINNNFFKDNADQNTGTEFDGWTPLLTTCIPVTDPSRLTLNFSVADIGDAAYMSAVYLDNVQFHSEQITAPITFKTLSEELLGVSGRSRLQMYTYPNPFLPGTGGRMTFSLTTEMCHLIGAGNGLQWIEIMDISGRRIITLPGGLATSVNWDGRNGQGNLVGSGMYMYHALSNTGRRGVGRFTIVR